MWIRVRSTDGKKTVIINNLSKLSKVEDLRKRLVTPFNAPVGKQRLFFRGKQLEDGHSLFDYDVGPNHMVQLWVREDLPPPSSAADSRVTSGYASSEDGASSDKENARPGTPEPPSTPVRASTSRAAASCEDCIGSTYKVGDVIDAMDPMTGAWFEADIVYIERAVAEGEVTMDFQSSDCVTDVNGNECDKVAEHALDPTSPDGSILNSGTGEGKQVNRTDCSSVSKDSMEDEEMKNEMTDTGEKTDSASPCSSNPDANRKDTGNDDVNMDNERRGQLKEEDDVGRADRSGVDSPCDLMDTSAEENAREVPTSGPSETRISDFRQVHRDEFLYSIVFEGYDKDEVVKVPSDFIRPRARHCIPFEEVEVGELVMVNYCVEEPGTRGFWYDSIISYKRNSRTCKELRATIFLGADQTSLDNCKLTFLDEIFAIEQPGTQITAADLAKDPSATPTKRQSKPECEECMDNPRKKCKHCACCECGGKNNPERQIICDECQDAYHLECLRPPLARVPEEDDWYCPDCKNDTSQVVHAGEKLKESKKKAKMPSAKTKSKRDWGKGMACAGRLKECTIVPTDHFGPIPGIEVGMMWRYRVQVSETGVHRPHVGGIHGREEVGAFSIVLSGGYEDDEDKGDEFTYTGSGGRDLSGNKRTAEQSRDQSLTRMNRALAKNCNAPINDKKGAQASNWKDGLPVRVVRKHSKNKFSPPKDAFRYDGIYKVVKYWPERGRSGFLVWRYLLRRDDPNPAPWTAAGKKKIAELGLTMQYPEGYWEKEEAAKGMMGKRKRSLDSPGRKKPKAAAYVVEKDVMKLIKEDKANKKLWDDALTHTKEGRPKFLSALQEVFTCVCCQDVLFKPVTLGCSHNVCKPCLKRSFQAEVYSCPACRQGLPRSFAMPVNPTLTKLLNTFFPGYENGR